MKIKSKILALTSLCVATTGILYADWEMQYDFESQGDLDAATVIANRDGSEATAELEDGMLKVIHGNLLEDTSNLWVMLPLQEDLIPASQASSDGTVTVYYEMVQPTVDGSKAIVDVAWGISNITSEEILEETYNSFNVMQRINSGNDNYEVRDGGDYVPIDILDADTRYKVWMVIDYELNFVDFYVQGGQWSKQTLIHELAEFRVNPGPDDTADDLLIGLSRGNIGDGEKGIDYMYFDNIAIDTSGTNLDPVDDGGSTEMWADWEVVQGGWVETGSFMGWLYVGHDPYIYSLGLEKYIYLPEGNVKGSGAWTFVGK